VTFSIYSDSACAVPIKVITYDPSTKTQCINTGDYSSVDAVDREGFYIQTHFQPDCSGNYVGKSHDAVQDWIGQRS
jgi:hypothetical protein